MAPTARPSRQLQEHQQPRQDVIPPQPEQEDSTDAAPDVPAKTIFIDPMMGTPLQIYIEKDVEDFLDLAKLIERHGGSVAPGYSMVPYILVDPHKESGQNLFRQYAGKKGKIVLNARWVRECIKAGELKTFAHEWGGCKVNGKETISTPAQPPAAGPSKDVPETPRIPASPRVVRTDAITPQPDPPVQHHEAPAQPIPPSNIHPPMLQAPSANSQVVSPGPGHPPIPPGAALIPPPPCNYYEHIYPPMHMAPRNIHVPPNGPPQPWQAPHGIVSPLGPPMPPHPPMLPRSIVGPAGQPPGPPPPYRTDSWEGYYPPPAAYETMIAGPSNAPYNPRYRDHTTGWIAAEGYQDQHYYQPSDSFVGPREVDSATEDTANGPATHDSSEKPRGRKRVRANNPPAPPAATLVLSRRNPAARSPTPPTRVVKSTYGGNLFTHEDVEYLKKYIDYCQQQGFVLSLREICERVAVKAPHHTFYSWRRYCNKHQIKLGGYILDLDRSPSPGRATEPTTDGEGPANREEIAQAPPLEQPQPQPPPPPPPEMDPSLAAALEAAGITTLGFRDPVQPSAPPPPPPPPPPAPSAPIRDRSPSPPKALFRSTTGKGVAFTEEDVGFLKNFFEYRKSQGQMDMVAFWKDVASKAPHHSRASWMKFYRRHKHEIHHTEGDDPLPQAPDKKMRYSRADDILLAKYFHQKPEGTSDKIFQAFARLNPHHPWKGWQEHHRIHKTEIDHLMRRLQNGENIDEPPPDMIIVEQQVQIAT